ncbi:MAG TPA: hypothetical protein VK508_15725 [Cyclobacteriaceae bacterium]|nr:hypothetical protein [Cyclobacteriaceae bacterium]
MKTSLTDFLNRAKTVHGTKYDYSKVAYSTTETKVTIVCPVHGGFLMRPRAHYQDKRGCPECDNGNKSGFSKESKWATHRIKTFYILEAFGEGERFIKVGLTTEDLLKRFQKGQFPYNYNLIYACKVKGGRENENRFLSKYQALQYQPKKKFRGDTECFEHGLKEHILKDAIRYFSAKE